MRVATAVALALATCLWLGCGRKAQTFTGPDGSKTTVTNKGNGVEFTVNGPDGESVHLAGSASGVALPDGFPSDVPIYPGAKVITSAKAKDTMTVVLTTEEPTAKVLQHYGEKLKDGGWNIEGTFNNADGGMVSAKKGARTCVAQASRNGSVTSITLAVSSAKK